MHRARQHPGNTNHRMIEEMLPRSQLKFFCQYRCGHRHGGGGACSATGPCALFLKVFWLGAVIAEEHTSHTLGWHTHFSAELDTRPQPALNAVAQDFGVAQLCVHIKHCETGSALAAENRSLAARCPQCHSTLAAVLPRLPYAF